MTHHVCHEFSLGKDDVSRDANFQFCLRFILSKSHISGGI